MELQILIFWKALHLYVQSWDYMSYRSLKSKTDFSENWLLLISYLNEYHHYSAIDKARHLCDIPLLSLSLTSYT